MRYSTKLYLGKLKKTLKRLALKVLIYTVLFTAVSYIGSHFVNLSMFTLMRGLGFGLMFAGAGSKVAGGDMARDFNYNYSMGAKKMRNRSSFERDTLNSGDKFLLFGVLTGSIVFGLSILFENIVML